MRLFLFIFSILTSLIVILSLSLFLFIRLGPHTQVASLTKPFGIYTPEVIGFQPYWLVKSGNPSYAKDVTTLAYFSLAVERDGSIRKEDKPGEGEPGWTMLNSDTYSATASSHRKSGTKLSLVVQNMVEDDILALIATPEAHAKTLVGEVAPVMQKHGFTDLNLDIESFTKASESARMGYVAFVQAVKNELTRLKLGTLTVELTPKSPVEMHMIDVARIGDIADYLVLMAYDYHYVFSAVAGAVAPIGGVPTTAEYDVETALKETLRYAPAEKVILGVPLYGYEWETLSNSPGAPVIPGSWQVTTGKRMDDIINTCTDCIKTFDQVAQEPYIIFPGETPRHYQQSFYENKEALQAKINLAKKYQLAGVAMWALGYESDGMLAPVSMYKNSVQYRGFGKKPAVPYTHIQPASYTLVPPTHALVGSISTMSGEVKKMGRQDDAYQVLEKIGPLVQGDAVAVGDTGVMTVEFPNAIRMNLKKSGELAFSELLAPNVAIRQKAGTVSYRLLSSDVPWSIRVLRSLVVLQDGEIAVVIDGADATITQLSGTSLVGNIDADNTTATYDLTKGQTAVLDESAQTVVIK